MVLTEMFLGLGNRLMAGIAHTRSTILSQNGSQRSLLVANEANVGPRKETTYEVELMYAKYAVLRRFSLWYYMTNDQ
jgi:hypothetical protein